MRIVLAGLDGSGKTTLARLLLTNALSEHCPTERVRFDKLIVMKTPLTLIDSSGDGDFGRQWLEYDCEAFIFVVDGTDRSRLGEVEIELKKLFVKKKPIAILFNKSDLVSFCPVSELTRSLNLETFNTENLPPLQGFECSVTKGLGFQEALNWLVSAAK